MGNLGKKWYRRNYFQGRNGDTDVENGCVDVGRRMGGG